MSLRIGAVIVDSRDPGLLFIKVPEARAGKNRVHFDVRPEDQAAEVARLEDEFCVQPACPPHVRSEWLRRYEAYQPAPR
jgi:hypothetical protein